MDFPHIRHVFAMAILYNFGMYISEQDIAFLKRDLGILRGTPNALSAGISKESAMLEMEAIIDRLAEKIARPADER